MSIGSSGGSAGSAAATKKAVTKKSPKTAKSSGAAPELARFEPLQIQDAARKLAGRAAEQSSKLYGAARALHDDVGPLLATAGLKLQLMQMDAVPAAGRGKTRSQEDEPFDATGPVDEVLELLSDAMERVRRLSQDLHASMVDRMGLKHALTRLAEQYPEVTLHYKATAQLPPRIAGLVYDAVIAAVNAAEDGKAHSIKIDVSGASGIRIRVTDDGSPDRRAEMLLIPQLLASAFGVVLSVEKAASGTGTKHGTIVSIRYASRRSTG